MNKRTKWKYFAVGLGFFALFLVLGTCTGGVLSPVPFLYLGSFHGKVVGAETKDPIFGAAVLAVYYKSTPSPAGSISVAVDAQETLTDDKGEFQIPPTMRWFSIRRGFTEARVIIFKPGYGAFPDHKRSEAVGENKSWPPSGKYIVYELPKLHTEEERKKNLHFDYYIGRTGTFIRLINEERKSLGLPTMSIPGEEDGR